jgi:hypothetical protein
MQLLNALFSFFGLLFNIVNEWCFGRMTPRKPPTKVAGFIHYHKLLKLVKRGTLPTNFQIPIGGIRSHWDSVNAMVMRFPDVKFTNPELGIPQFLDVCDAGNNFEFRLALRAYLTEVLRVEFFLGDFSDLAVAEIPHTPSSTNKDS